MDELFALFSSDIDADDEGVGGPVGYGNEGIVDVGGQDRQEQDDDDEEEEDIGLDLDLDLSESRPVKRSRSGAAVSPAGAVAFGAGDRDDSSSSGDLRSRGRGGSGAMDEDEEEQEVIEILSDDDYAQPLARRSRQAGHGLVDREDATAQDGESAFAGTGGAREGAGGASFALSSTRSSSIRDRRGGLKGYHASPASGSKRELDAMAGDGIRAQKPADAAAAPAAATGVAASPSTADPSAGVLPPFKSVVGGGPEEDGEGKPSAEQKGASGSAAAGQDARGSGWLGGLVAAAKAATSKINTTAGHNNLDGKSGQIGTALSASGDFPLNLECAICFNPLAVTALFACGHGSCWECAHDWCSRETSATMDCPTCHVSVPRSDFRRCVVLDQVVDRAVLAAGMDDDEWRARLERGQKLAREAETRRRDSRDAQRSAEETIAKQAAELKRLKEEAKEARSRGGSGRRAWRSYDQGLPPSMADYGFRLMSSGGRDLLDPASQKRSAIEEFTRLRHRGAGAGEEPVPSSRRARAPGDAAVVAAAAFGMPPSGTYGGLRQRGGGGGTQSGLGIPEGDPWFSLRPSQPSRQQAGMGMSGGRMVMSGGRMVRADSFGRSGGNAAAAGLEQQAVGAAMKSVHQRTSGGSNWRSAYLNPGRVSSLSGEEGGCTRTRAGADSRGVGIVGAGAPYPPGAGRDPAAQSSPPLFGSARAGHGPHVAAGASSPYPSGGGVGLATPPGSQYDTSGFGGRSQREQPRSRGGGGGGGGRYVGHRGRTSAAPTLDLDELIMSGPDDNTSRSEWDDVLASVSTPSRPADGLGRSASPDANQQG
eukprot:g7045.t2